MPISRSWVEKEVESLTGRDRAFARFALVLAKAPYQVDETLVREILPIDGDETRFIRVLAWASFSAARGIAARVALSAAVGTPVDPANVVDCRA